VNSNSYNSGMSSYDKYYFSFNRVNRFCVLLFLFVYTINTVLFFETNSIYSIIILREVLYDKGRTCRKNGKGCRCF